jgi:hypothetical protein
MMIESPEIWRQIIQKQQEEWIETAEQDRLVHEIRLSRKRSGFYCGLMCWLGRRLIAIGSDLLAHFSEEPFERPMKRRRHAA